MQTNKIRFPALDFLRFLAAFLVMLMHITHRGFPNDSYYKYDFGIMADLVKWNYLAVDLFFLISGFVILLTAKNRSFKQFFVSRFLRLYPAYWICCTASFILTYFFLNQIFHPSLFRYLLNMTMFNGFFKVDFIDGVYWTLFIELKFYILVAIIIYFNKINTIENLLWMWLFVDVVNYYFGVKFIEDYFITRYAAFFMSGAMLYLIAIDQFAFKSSRYVFILIAFFVGIEYEKLNLLSKAQHFGIDYSVSQLYLAMLVIYLLFFVGIKIHNVSEKLSNFLIKLGKSSYPLYLMHLTLSITALNIFAPKGSNRYLVAISLLILLPYLAYYFAIKLEEPIRAKLKYLLSKANLE